MKISLPQALEAVKSPQHSLGGSSVSEHFRKLDALDYVLNCLYNWLECISCPLDNANDFIFVEGKDCNAGDFMLVEVSSSISPLERARF